MNREDLKNDIDIIFEKEILCLENNTTPWNIKNDAEINVLEYEHSDTLISIYSGLPTKELKKDFVEYLIQRFRTDKEIVKFSSFNYDIDVHSFSSIIALMFFTLLRLNFIQELKEELTKKAGFQGTEYFNVNITLLSFLNDLLITKKKYFGMDFIPDMLNFVKSMISTYGDYDYNLIQNVRKLLAETGYAEVRQHTLGVNIEINRDKEKLIGIFSNNGFSSDYEKYLQEIDEFIDTNNSAFMSGVASTLRSFMQNLLTDLSNRIATNLNEEIPAVEGRTEMGNFRYYLQKRLGLTDKDNILINKYIDVLNAKDSHVFTSTIEYFRLSKNIGIEISLFLLSKANELRLLQSVSFESNIPF